MMDHLPSHAKDKPGDCKPSGRKDKSDDDDQSSYYYDDSTNYEVYREHEDEVDELPSPTEEAAD